MKNTSITIFFLFCFLLQGIAQTVNIFPESGDICSGDMVSFSYSYTGLVEPITCEWDFGDGIISSNCSPNHTYSEEGITYQACLTVTDANNLSIQECTEVTQLESILNIPDTLLACNDCGVVCLDFPIDSLSNYQIVLNGVIVPASDFVTCESDVLLAYTYFTLAGMGEQGPYELLSWTVNGQSHTGTFDNPGELVDLMNQVDPLGNWELNEENFIIMGGLLTNDYSIIQVQNLAENNSYSDMDYNEGTLPIKTGFCAPVGIHQLEVIDLQNGCEETKTVEIIDGTPIVSIPPVDPICEGGTAFLSCIINNPSPDNPITLYEWTGDGLNTTTGQTLEIGNLSTGSYDYTVTATDSNGCTSSATTTIVVFPGVELQNIIITEASCGGSDGTVEIAVIENYPPYTCEWSDGSTNCNRTGLAAGAYSVTITDGNGCTDAVTFAVGNLDGPLVTVDYVTPNTCDLADGGVSLLPPNYLYEWPDGGVGSTRSDLVGGIYEVTVTDPSTPNCPSVIEVSIPGLNPLVISANETNPNCGQNNGFVTIVVGNGSGDYSYVWSDGGIGPIRTDLMQGIHQVTITDLNWGCEEVVTLLLIEEELPEVTVTINDTDIISCAGGNDGFLNYSISPSAGYSSVLKDVQGNLVVNGNLSEGDYCIEVYDVNLGCLVGLECFQLLDPAAIDVDISITAPSTCGEADGTIDVSATGGTGVLTYEWNIGATSEDLINLGVGAYSLTVTDGNNCTVEVNSLVIGDGSGLSVSVDAIIPATCDAADGTVSLSPLNYDYIWADGWNGANHTGMTSGTYYVTVTDPVIPSCVDIFEITIPETNPLTVTMIDIVNPSCGEANGSATILAENGSGNYNYMWSTNASTMTHTDLGAGIYTVTVTDSTTGCVAEESVTLVNEEIGEIFIILPLGVIYACEEANDAWLSYSTDPEDGVTTTISDLDGNIYENGTLSVGDYIIRAYDENGCLAAEDNSSITSYGTMNIDLQVTNPSACGLSDGTVDATVTGGGGTLNGLNPYTFLWSTGMNTEDVTGLNAGTYTVTVVSYLGCEGIEEVTLEEDQVITPEESTIVLCPGEIATLTADVNGATYLWSEGAISQSINTDVVGSYMVTITEANNCTGVQSFIVESANDCVWPGDANYDGFANNQDVLFLGMAYGNTGQARVISSIDWEGQLASFEWDSTYSNGINQKHADSDGNGIVEHDDTLAIFQNYNLPAHELRETSGGENILQVDFNSSTSDYGQYVELEVNLAELEETVPEAYGLAFSIVFNYPEVIKQESVQVDFANSVFGPSSETISLYKFIEEEGRMDFAVTRFDHINLANLQGEVVKVGFIIEDNIDGFVPVDNYVLDASLTNIFCIKAYGEEVLLAPTSSELTMLGSNSITDLDEVTDVLDYYPNPTRATLYLDMKGNSTITKVRVFDTLGRLVTEENGDDIEEIKTEDWEAGMYFFEVTSNKEEQYLLRIIKE